MANFRSVSFNVPEAKRLADLTGVEFDLIHTQRLCERFLAERALESPDWEMLEILCAAAVVRYVRTMPNGTRAGVTSTLLKRLSEDHRYWHKYFKDARDKWIAHSVNTFEENEVSVWLMPEERGPLGVTSVSVRQTRVTSLGKEAIEALSSLCIAVRELLAEEISAEKIRVLAIAQSMPPEPFYAQTDAIRSVGQKPPGQARSSTRRPRTMSTVDAKVSRRKP